MVTVPPTMQIMAGMHGATQGGVCANDAHALHDSERSCIDCGGSNTCLVAPQSGPWHPVVGAFEISFYAPSCQYFDRRRRR